MMNLGKIWSTVAIGSAVLASCTLTDVQEGAAAGEGGDSATAGGQAAVTGSTSQGGSTAQASAGTSTAGADGTAGSKKTGATGAGGRTGGQAAAAGAGAGGDNGGGGDGGAGGDGPAPACSNTQTDAENCGSCGHSCLGGECQSGKCQPVLLAEEQFRVSGLALDDGYAYWPNFPGPQNIVGQGRIQRASFSGDGKIEAIVSDQANPSGPVFEGDYLFFSNVLCCSSTIMRVKKTGGTPTPIASGQAGPQGVFLDGGIVYWANHVAGGAVMAVATTNGTAAPLYANQDRPQWIAADATNLYWTELEAGTIRKGPKTGGASGIAIVTGEKNPVLLSVAGGYLFWRNDSGMMRLPLNAGSAAAFEPQEQHIGPLTTDAQTVVWANDVGIRQAPFAGGTPTTVISSADAGTVSIVALDAKSVVWTDSTGGKIWRLAR